MAPQTVVSSGVPQSAVRSASVSPHHGARSTASHAVRSARCDSARVSASRSCTTGRSPRGSISIARKARPAARSRGITSRRWLRFLTRIATRASPDRATISATSWPSGAPSPSRKGCTCTALPSCGCTACDGEYATAPVATSSSAGMMRPKLVLTQSTRPACERKLAERVRGSSATLPMPWRHARMKSATSASRKR